MSEKRIELLFRRDQCELVLAALAYWDKQLSDEGSLHRSFWYAGKYTRSRIDEVKAHIDERMGPKE